MGSVDITQSHYNHTYIDDVKLRGNECRAFNYLKKELPIYITKACMWLALKAD